MNPCSHPTGAIDVLEMLRTVLIHNPGHVKSMIHLGAVYAAKGFYSEAREILNQVLERDPNNPNARWYMAFIEHQHKAW